MRVGVIFGGRSCEHDISIITGVMAAAAAKEKHAVTPIYIGGDGVWYTGRGFDEIKTFADKKYKKKRVHLRPASNGLYTNRGRKIATLDAIIVCCHGRGGEDGTLAGLLELSGIPYAGSGVLASAAGMDKIVQKQLFVAGGVATTPFVGVSRSELSADFFEVIAKVSTLTFPLMVKPATLGSSIGIGRANDFKQLFERLSEAFEWDNRVIIENALTNFIEVNCAVLGEGEKLIVSQIEQPLSAGFLSFYDKYERAEYGNSSSDSSDNSGFENSENFDSENIDSSDGSGFDSIDDSDGEENSGSVNNKNDNAIDGIDDNDDGGEPEFLGSKGGSGRYLPAHIPSEMAAEVRATAKKVFSLLGCSGVARVDFLIKDDKLFVNEINTVPGSLSSYLFAFDGMDFGLLIDKLLQTAFDKHKNNSRLRLSFDSNVLQNCGGAKSAKNGSKRD